jgi:hypothetical protein
VFSVLHKLDILILFRKKFMFQSTPLRVSVVFVGPRTSADLVSKPHVSLHAKCAPPPKFT